MTAGLVASVILGIVVLAVVVAPLLRPENLGDERRAERLSRARELYSRRDMLLAALKDLDDDHATDKIDDEDHATLKARLSSDVLDVLREIDTLDLDAEEPPQLRIAGRGDADPAPGPG